MTGRGLSPRTVRTVQSSSVRRSGMGRVRDPATERGEAASLPRIPHNEVRVVG